MKKRTIAILTVSLLLLIVGTVWAFRGRSDAQLQKVRAMGKELFDGKGQPDPQKFEEFRNAMGQLQTSQRQALREEGHRAMERHEDQVADAFAALPAAKRNQFLDEQIKDEEQRNQERARRRAQWAAEQGRTPGQGGPNSNSGQQARRNRSLDENTERRNARLDRSTPEQRAHRAAYRAAMDQRRKQLGLPAHPGPGMR